MDCKNLDDTKRARVEIRKMRQRVQENGTKFPWFPLALCDIDDDMSAQIREYYKKHPIQWVIDAAKPVLLFLAIVLFCAAFVYFAFKLAFLAA